MTVVADPIAKSEVEEFRSRATKMASIPLTMIRKSDIALRDVQRNSEGYQQLLESVRTRGVLNSITVREQIDPVTNAKVYGLIDGLQRFTCACDAGMEEIPANIVTMDDAEILEAQLITNLNRIETRPVDQSKHLLRILSRNPFMTKDQLASKVCQSRTWIDQRLGLSDLTPEIQELVNTNKIQLSNAYALSSIPVEEQAEFVEAAMSESATTFVPRMKQRVKEIREARKKGDDHTPVGFQPVQYMQKISDVKAEFDAAAIGRLLIAKHNVTTPEEAWKLAIAWILHFDTTSQEEQRREHSAKAEKISEEREKRKKEREEAKAKEVAANTMDLTKGL